MCQLIFCVNSHTCSCIYYFKELYNNDTIENKASKLTMSEWQVGLFNGRKVMVSGMSKTLGFI